MAVDRDGVSSPESSEQGGQHPLFPHSNVDPVRTVGIFSLQRQLQLRHLVALIAVLISVIAIGAGLPDSSQKVAVWRQSNGVVAINLDHVRPVYRGVTLTPQELHVLNAEGKAMISMNNVELACQGVSLHFDTELQLSEYQREYKTREYQRQDLTERGMRPPDNVDPCVLYADAPRFASQ